MGAAANSVSKTLEGRRTRSEQKEDLFELKDRELADEEELFRRKNRREQENEMKNWIATINSYLTPEQAQEVILNATSQGHQYVGVAAQRVASLADNGISSSDVYKTNKSALDPANTNYSTIPFGDLLIPRKKVTGDKFTQYQARFVDLSVRRSQTNDPDTLKLLDDEQKLLEKDFAAYQKIVNSSNKTESEYKSNFSKQSASSTIFGEFDNIMKSYHNIDLSAAEEIRNWKKGNEVLVMDQMTKFSTQLDKNLKRYQENGMKIENEPSYISSKAAFQAMAKNNLTVYLTREYKNFANNKPSKLKTNENGEVVALTSKEIQTNLDNGMYNEGDVVPIVFNNRNGNWIYSGYKNFGQNIISLSPKKDN